MEEGVITGFNAALPWQPAPSEPTPSGAVLHTPNCSAASVMLSSLCCNVRQGITQMARMRCCVWCAGTPSSQAAPMAVFVTNAGGVGLIQQLPKWLTGPLCNLQDTLARGVRSGGVDRGPVWPPRASAHQHRSTWCSYTYKEPFCDKTQWQERMAEATDELYNGGPVKGFSAQSMAVDAELLKSWMLHAEESGMHVRRSSNGNGSGELSKVPWKAIRALNYLAVFGLMYVPHIRSLEQELVRL